MTRRLAAALVVVVCLPAIAQDGEPEALHYGFWIGRARVGSGRTELTALEVEGRPGWRFRQVIEMRVVLEAGVSVRRSDESLLLTEGFQPVARESREEEDGQVEIVRVEYAADRVVRVVEHLGRTTRQEIETDGPIEPDDETFLRRMIDAGRMAPGARFEVRDVSFDHGRTHAKTYVVAAAAGDGWRLTMTEEIAPDVEVGIVVDGRGRLIEASHGPMVIRRIDAADAGRFDDDLAARTTFPCRPAVTGEHLGRLVGLTVAVELSADGLAFPEDGYQEVVAVDGRTHVLRLVGKPGPAEAIPLPLADERLAFFVRPTDEYQADDPAIVERAAEVAGAAREAGAVARSLCRWVHDNLGKRSNGAGLSALETLRAGEGDCTEHTALYVAMARSLGLPTRAMSGLKYDGQAFVRHAWAESWIGRWVPVDPAWGAVGVGPTYLSLGPEHDEDGIARTRSLEMAFVGDVALGLVSIDLGGQVFDARQSGDVLPAPAAGQAFEEVRLRGGLVFPGRLVDVEGDRLVFRTPYGRTLVERSDAMAVEFRAGRGEPFASVEHGLAFDLPAPDWRIDPVRSAEDPKFICLFQAASDHAAGLLMHEAFEGDLAAYRKAVARIVKGLDEATSDEEAITLPGPEGEVPALHWRFESRTERGTILRYHMILWQRGKTSYRLALWALGPHYDDHRRSFEGLIESLELR